MPKRASRDGVFERSDCAGWYASYVDGSGKRRKQRVQAYTRPQALQALAELKARAQKEKILGVKYVSEMSTSDFLERYKKAQRSSVGQATRDRIEVVATNLLARMPKLLKEITRVTVAEYVAERSNEVAAATVHKEVTILKHALRLAVQDWGLINSNPADGVKLPKASEGRTRYLSPTELRAVLEAAPDWMRAPLALAAFTGMRRGEILKLRWRDVDLAGKRIYLHETKNGSLRVLPLNDLANSVLTSLPTGKPGDLVLPDVDPKKLSVYTRRLFASVGIEDASFHSLRHTAASWLVMRGADIYAVGKLLGHRTPRMTMRYSHLSPGYLAETANKLDSVFEMPESRDSHGTNLVPNRPKLG